MKFSSVFTIVLFLLLIFPLTVAFLIKDADEFSPEENRKLQQLPEFTVEDFLSGKLSSDLNKYINDQFPLRDTFVGIKSFTEKLLQKGENNGVLLGKNGQLAVRIFSADDGEFHPASYSLPKTDLYFKNHIEESADAIIKLYNGLNDAGIDVSVMVPPRTVDVASSAFNYPDTYSKMLTSHLSGLLKDIGYVDVLPILKEKYDSGEYVYYKTDHHWTSLGAYYAYAEVMKSFGEEYYGINEFESVTVSESFLGTTYSKSGYKNIDPDTVTVLEHKDIKSTDFVTKRPFEKAENGGVTHIDGLYFQNALEQKDKYPYFLGGTTPYINITRNSGEARERLVIIGDSFAFSLAPMLALHYDIDFVRLADWRSVLEMYDITDTDKVLVVWNFENIVTSSDIIGTSGLAKKFGE